MILIGVCFILRKKMVSAKFRLSRVLVKFPIFEKEQNEIKAWQAD